MATTDPTVGADFEHMFDLAPVSLWLEDYSGVRQLFARWRSQGVEDVVDFLTRHPERISDYGTSIRVLRVNQRTLTLFAAPDERTLVSSLYRVFCGDMAQHVMAEIAQLWSGIHEFDNQTVNYALDGRRLDVHVRGRVLPGYEACWSRVLVSLEDNTAEQRSRAALADSEQYARMLFEYSPVSLWVEDFSGVRQRLDALRSQGVGDLRAYLEQHPGFVEECVRAVRVIDVNQATLTLVGAPDKQTLLGRLDKVFRGEMFDSFAQELADLWEGRLFQQRETVNYRLSGEEIYAHMQLAVQEAHREDWSVVLLSLVDITARKKDELYLEYLGKHDVLTGLRNRAFYVEELHRLSRQGPWPVGVVMIDLNGLKTINDERGHAAGDAMLRRAGEVLGKAADRSVCVARIGGDEFCVLLPGQEAAGVRAMLGRIAGLQDLNNQFYPGQALSFSMGSAVAAAPEQMDQALHQADRAMYAQKTRHYAAQDHNRRTT